MPETDNQRTFTDMLGRAVYVAQPPRRIVSLVPSQTELLWDLGLDDEVVGITKFCVHPETWFRSKRRVGGTKTINIAVVKELQPDLVIANKEENTREQIEELAALFQVWVSDIHTVEEALRMIADVGALTDRAATASELITEISQGFGNLANVARGCGSKRVAYFIWRKPWMCAGGDTFINDIIERCGWTNALADLMRYPEITLEELKNRKADLILLSSEPYPFKDVHIAEIKAVLQDVDVKLVDGEMFSWYGSRMKEATKYLAELLVQLG